MKRHSDLLFLKFSVSLQVFDFAVDTAKAVHDQSGQRYIHSPDRTAVEGIHYPDPVFFMS